MYERNEAPCTDIKIMDIYDGSRLWHIAAKSRIGAPARNVKHNTNYCCEKYYFLHW